MSGENNSRDRVNDRIGRRSETSRRRFLAGIGVAGSAAFLSSGRASAAGTGDCAKGPFARSYAGATVNLANLKHGGSSDGGDTGSGGDSDTGVDSPLDGEEVPLERVGVGGTDDGTGSGGSGGTGGHGTVGQGQRARDTDGGLGLYQEYDALGYADTRGFVPSDAQLAVGRSSTVVAINSQLGVYSQRSGSKRLQLPLDRLFDAVIPSGNYAYGFPMVFDPRVRYDHEADRFVVACVQYDTTANRGYFLLGVSDNGNPNGKWHTYRISPLENAGLVDYPALGVGDEAMYLTQNHFPSSFQAATMLVLDKSDLYAGRTVSTFHFTDLRNPDGTLADSIQPALGSAGGDGHSLVNSQYPTGDSAATAVADGLTLWTVRDPVGSPSLECTNVPVDPYQLQPAAEQPNTDGRIDTGDTRLINVATDGNSLWTAHGVRHDWNDDGDSTTAIRWYQLDPSGTLLQSGLYGAPDVAHFYPAVEANGDSMAMVYNVSGPDTFPGMKVAGRTDGYDAGKLQGSLTVQSGESAYDYGESVMRWGDYNGISVDSKTGRYWAISQYSPDANPTDSTDPYDTRVAEFDFE